MVMIEVFDPAMCCSTGVCGPSVDPALASFAADLDWLSTQGLEVRRFNLSQEPGEFATRSEVHRLLSDKGEGALPVVMVEGAVVSDGRYPSRDELAAWVGMDIATSPAPAGGCCGDTTETADTGCCGDTTETADTGCCGDTTETADTATSGESTGCCG
ncbi:MAG TPA: arsenite efflux transporter metallochaperone ArsD [Acidimicrobiales bacterium]|nr:arsenite efflux transporter metallochaperone ArsD [Acidimicrobiales bacterium]